MILTGEQLSTEPTELVNIDDAEEIIKQLEWELKHSPRLGIGLAASQIGINKAVAIVRMSNSIDPTNPIQLDLVNPRLVDAEDLIQFDEGCLSFDGQVAKTIRYKYIWVETMDNYNYIAEQMNAKRYNRDGNDMPRLVNERRVIGLGGENHLAQLISVCVQHEMAHLIGLDMFKFAPQEVGRNDICPCGRAKNKKCHNYNYYNNNLKRLFNPNYRSV